MAAAIRLKNRDSHEKLTTYGMACQENRKAEHTKSREGSKHASKQRRCATPLAPEQIDDDDYADDDEPPACS